MEYLIIVIASILSGIGISLVNLPIATLTVPLLIVLCTSFQGVNGTFIAIGVALTIELFASLFNTIINIKNKNINFKKSWLLLLIASLASVSGAIASYYTQGEILTGLIFAISVIIGVTFLYNHTQKEDINQSDSYSSLQYICIVFLGLCSGFCGGYFGINGGMIIVVILLSILKFDRKNSVGTLSLLMTLTALSGSITHISFSPTIITSYWPFILIGSGVSIIFVILFNKLKSRFNFRIVNYVVAGVVIILSLSLLYYNYRDFLNQHIVDFLKPFLGFCIYVIPVSLILILVKYKTKIPQYIFRKLLHTTAYVMIFPIIFLSNTFYMADIVIGAIAFCVIVILLIVEPYSWFHELLIEKRKYEIMFSLLSFLIVFAGINSLLWGILGDNYKFLPIAAILAWGTGDCAAAIVGIKYGKHKLQGFLIEGAKSIEGSIAYVIVASIAVFITLIISQYFSWWLSILIAVLCGIFGSLAELFTKRGYDTVSCPLVSALILLIFAFTL